LVATPTQREVTAVGPRVRPEIDMIYVCVTMADLAGAAEKLYSTPSIIPRRFVWVSEKTKRHI
jgi:hypothetical protein